MKVQLFYLYKLPTNKISWQVKSYANTGQFFLCFNSKTQWDGKRIVLTFHNLKTGLYLAWIKHGATLITTQDVEL